MLQEGPWPAWCPPWGPLQASVCAEGRSQQGTCACVHTPAVSAHPYADTVHTPAHACSGNHIYTDTHRHSDTQTDHKHTPACSHLNSLYTHVHLHTCVHSHVYVPCATWCHTRVCPPQLVHTHVHVRDHHSPAPQHPLPGTHHARTPCCMSPLLSQPCQAQSPWPRGKQCGIWRRATNCIAMATRHRGLISPRIQPGSWLTSEQPRATASWQGHGQNGCSAMGYRHTDTSAGHGQAQWYLEEVLAVEGGLAHQPRQRAGSTQG